MSELECGSAWAWAATGVAESGAMARRIFRIGSVGAGLENREKAGVAMAGGLTRPDDGLDARRTKAYRTNPASREEIRGAEHARAVGHAAPTKETRKGDRPPRDGFGRPWNDFDARGRAAVGETEIGDGSPGRKSKPESDPRRGRREADMRVTESARWTRVFHREFERPGPGTRRIDGRAGTRRPGAGRRRRPVAPRRGVVDAGPAPTFRWKPLMEEPI